MRLSQSINLKKAILVTLEGLSFFGFSSRLYALEGDVIRPYVSATYSYDDNLRRFNSKQRALSLTGNSDTSDTVFVKSVGIILDKQISQQKIFANVNLNRSTYDRNSELDNDGKELTGRWDWSIGRRWDGNVEIYHKEAMVPFSDFQQGVMALNTRTQDRRSFEARWLFHPRWRVRGGITNSETKFSAEIQQAANLEENSQLIALDYLSPSKSMVGVVYRHAKGIKPDQVFQGFSFSNNYDQNELKLNVDWTVTGKSKLQFLGGLVDRQHEELSGRDFRVFNARGNFSWMPAGKTAFNFSIWRENNAQSFVTTSYTANKGGAVYANYYATGKITLQGSIRYEKRDFEGDVIFGQQRSDKDKNYSLALIYRPIESLQLNTSLTHASRKSSNENFDFDSNGLSFTAKYEF
ncbi:XrtB/PEP-CTERM-associated polysaccharide biosynthesis outer membrane protein EpsL [Methylobacillus methanolivorans]|uniref:XrtB/PEP-CTERM-associated polysaccharide biosynthesis outer membrane protein EpsL n=1 Tax=Methylobacillus methanolivorans TaxID=1848927 RepID=A0ABW8GH20_9PROT